MTPKKRKNPPKRRYASPARAQASADSRSRIIMAATRLLRGKSGIANFSLDGVAKAAGVTRLTVYNQFHSRSGVLEAVFASLAAKGGILRLGDVAAIEPPLAALDRLVEIFCDFWASDPAIGPIFDAMATDPEIAAALAPRMDKGPDYRRADSKAGASKFPARHCRPDRRDDEFSQLPVTDERPHAKGCSEAHSEGLSYFGGVNGSLQFSFPDKTKALPVARERVMFQTEERSIFVPAIVP
jgi:AcrR family transcriptional regulator